MSQANAAARKRRAGGASFEPANPTPQNSQQQQLKPGTPAGLTLPQVIAVVDARLIALETFVKESKNAPAKVQVQAQAQTQISDETIDELNDKFEILANEIADLKDIVLKLQSYTMEVNKTLMEERISILSDVNVSSDNKSQDGVTFNLTELAEGDN
jgi:hypothetical protein